MIITIVTPTLNSNVYLAEALKSISSKKALEHVVVDGLSSDGTTAILALAKNKNVHLRWISRSDSGPAEAINFGFKGASGDIIGWLNSDDVYAPGAIDAVLSEFEKNPELVMVYGLGDHIDASGSRLSAYPTLPPSAPIRKFLDGCFICQPTVFFRKEVLARVGFLDEQLHVAFDFDFWIRIFKSYPRGRIGFLNKVLAYSRLHTQCLTMRYRRSVAVEGMATLSKYFKYAPAKWFLSYLNEICGSYPNVPFKESLSEHINKLLLDVKPYISPVDYEKLRDKVRIDLRVAYSSKQLFLNIEPDGWVIGQLEVRFKWGPDLPRVVLLDCIAAWPKAAIKSGGDFINIKIKSPNGNVQKTKVKIGENFLMRFEAPEEVVDSYTAWIVTCENYFIPKCIDRRSKDARHLAFQVMRVSVE